MSRRELASGGAGFFADRVTRAARLLVIAGLSLGAIVATADHTVAQNGYSSRALVDAGMQASLICNGLFVSNRTIDQLYATELKLEQMPLAPPEQLTIDRNRKTVAIGEISGRPGPVMRAAYREGLGCVVLGPEQTFTAVESLPTLQMPPLEGDPSKIAWPDGDLVEPKPLPAYIDQNALNAAAEWTFDRPKYSHVSQITMSLLVVHRGDIVLERYAPGVDMTTKTRTWSTAKSIAATLIGIAIGEGKLALDAPLPFKNWGAGQNPVPDSDPRTSITLRSVLNMSSGLYPVDDTPDVSVSGSPLAYFGGLSSAAGARDRRMIRKQGTTWNYQNYDSLLGVYALRTAIGDSRKYLEYPRRALFDRVGMRNTVPGIDRFGDYVLSSQVYTNARDLARLGLLYLNGGTWNGKRILAESWIRFVRTPAPATRTLGRLYGGQFWLVPDDHTDLPQDAYSTAGSRGQFTIIVPSHDLVIVRRGEDYLARDSFENWDLLRKVLKAFPKGRSAAKLK